MNSNGWPGYFACTDPEGSWIRDQQDEPPQDRMHAWAADHPLEPGDVRLEQQERDWERDEAEAAEERFGDDPGRVDA